MLVDDDASDDEELVDELLIACCDPLIRERKEEIGPERLSLQRLHRDAAAAGLASETMSANIYCDYRFRLEDLPAVVQAPRSASWLSHTQWRYSSDHCT